MNVVVFHGSPRRANTYHATKVFTDELLKHSSKVHLTEFHLPKDLPVFCTGCALCMSGRQCPNSQHVAPIVDAIMVADALIFSTPHYGACDMPGSMKNLIDHLDFLVMNVSPRAEIFGKKAFILTTSAGTTAAIKPIRKFLKHWGINRVYSLGLRLYTEKWEAMPEVRQAKFESKLRQSARKFFHAKKGRPYLSAVFYYHMSKFIIKKYVGEGNYPYEYWKEKGYFTKRPF